MGKWKDTVEFSETLEDKWMQKIDKRIQKRTAGIMEANRRKYYDESFNAEGRPIWKPMHLHPMHRGNEFITVNGRSRGDSDAYIDHGKIVEVTTDIFNRGLCLPSDNKQTREQAEVIIEVVKRCFG